MNLLLGPGHCWFAFEADNVAESDTGLTATIDPLILDAKLESIVKNGVNYLHVHTANDSKHFLTFSSVLNTVGHPTYN